MSRWGAIALLAWIALILPWERCRAECHDRVVPAVGGHDCHTAGQCGASHEESEHEAHSFFSLAPARAPVFAPAALLEVAFGPEGLLAFRVHVVAAAPGEPPGIPRTVVLLL